MRFAQTRVTAPALLAGSRPYDLLKRPLDLTLGLLLFILAAPVIAVGWLAVRLTSRGPGVYSQTRSGRFGRPFRIYKLRSMYHNCERASGVRWSTKGDSRVTPVGRVIRKLHIDELPQLWNVLKGDMSLVGPRPERPEFVGPLQGQIPGYARRMDVRPGVTGLAQIQLPPDTTIESVRAKLVRDLYYVNHCGLGLDARVLFGTALHVLGLPFAAVRVVAGLPDVAGRDRPEATITPQELQEPAACAAFATRVPAA
jgi:lipopolysaccharide/colanic/teichoic acid biosynthesis glycosyltransferase